MPQGLAELPNEPEAGRLTGTHGRVRPGVLERAEQWYSSRAAEDDQLYPAVIEQAAGHGCAAAASVGRLP